MGQSWRLRFFTIWSGQALSLLGSGLVQFALVWWLTVETGSATVLALATLVAMLPGILIGPFAGVIADRWNRRLILIVADGVVALATLALLLVYTAGRMEVWHIYAAMFVRSTAGAFHFPTMAASTTMLVPQEQLTRVGGLNQALEGLVRIVSPALGALLLSVSNLSLALMVDIVTACVAILPLLFIAIPQPALTPEQAARETGAWVLHDMRDGLRYLTARRGLLWVVLLATGINLLLAPAFALLPLLVNKVFGGGAGALALAEMLGGVGAIAGGAVLAVWGGFRRKMDTAAMGLVGLGVGGLMIGLAPVTAFWLVVAGMFVTGAMGAFTNGPIMAIFQTVVEPAMQARVLALLGSIAMATSPIGLLVAGPVADTLGVRTWYLLGAGICILVGLLVRFVPALAELERHAAEVAAARGPAAAVNPAQEVSP